jgi:hypothetical protein
VESESSNSQSAIRNPQSAIATPVVVLAYFVYNIFKNQRPFEKTSNPTLNPSPQAGRDFKSRPFLPSLACGGRAGDRGKDIYQMASQAR